MNLGPSLYWESFWVGENEWFPPNERTAAGLAHKKPLVKQRVPVSSKSQRHVSSGEPFGGLEKVILVLPLPLLPVLPAQRS